MVNGRIAGEQHTFIIALFVIGSFILYFGLVLFYLHDTTALEKMTAGFGGFVAAILGYFFGQRPVAALSQQVQDAAKQRDEIKEQQLKTLDATNRDKEIFRKLKEQIEDMEKRIGEE